MSEMKDSGIGWIGIIPEDWDISKIKYHLHRNETRNPGNMQVLSIYREYGVIPKDSRDDNHNVTSDDTSNYKYVKIADIISTLILEIENDEEKYKGKSILNIVENMRKDCIEKVITEFCDNWYASKEDVMYVAENYRNGEIANESAIKATSDYSKYKESQEKALPKFKYYSQMMAQLRKILEEEIKPLLNN